VGRSPWTARDAPSRYRALNLVQEWATMHSGERLEDWRLCRENARPNKVEPLQ